MIVIGGGHAGAEAAWSAANLLPAGEFGPRGVLLVTMDPSKIGAMSCNPSIGGLAKGQLVREVDAMGGLMGLAADATGIMFKVLNASRGLAVRGPRAQCDKHAYARVVRGLLASRPEIEVLAGSVEELIVERGRIGGVVVRGADGGVSARRSPAVVLTTGTFMRGLMHTGESRTKGGRFGEGSSEGISGALRGLGFELGRLKTGTPPRLDGRTIDWGSVERQAGDEPARAFCELTEWMGRCAGVPEDLGGLFAGGDGVPLGGLPARGRFPVLGQVRCGITATTPEVHDLIRANLHRAPMYSGQIGSIGPRYCPSIEDKVVRFGEREMHTVFLEPESHEDDWVYCNGISTSLPEEVQREIVRRIPGCARAAMLRPGYAVEYDMVRPHQILTTGMTRRVEGLFLAGQINGTSGYEEAAGQGVVAGINAARRARGEGEWSMGREEGYIGVMMDDLVCKTPTEPYRMFTSRAEHRLILRSDNACDRLTPVAEGLGLLGGHAAGRARLAAVRERSRRRGVALDGIRRARVGGEALEGVLRRSEFTEADLVRALPGHDLPESLWANIYAEARYGAYVERQRVEVRRRAAMEHRRLPEAWEGVRLGVMRTEARQALERFRPRTFGQAGRLEGITPADLTLLSVLVAEAGCAEDPA